MIAELIQSRVVDLQSQPVATIRGAGGYHGCGRAWAAVDGGRIMRLAYMGDYSAPRFHAETEAAFVAAWRRVHPRMDVPPATNRWDSRRRKFEDAESERLEREAGGFMAWRTAQLAELRAKFPGAKIISGECSCWQFICYREV